MGKISSDLSVRVPFTTELTALAADQSQDSTPIVLQYPEIETKDKLKNKRLKNSTTYPEDKDCEIGREN
jgi:hypothetical protein